MNKENENIEKEELIKMAPTLFGIKKVNNLKAPKGYFSNLADTVKVRIDNEVPDGYFENLADMVIDKIEKEETKVIPIQKRNIARIISVAASIAAIFIIGFLLNQNNIKEAIASSDNYLENLTASELDEAMDYNEMDDLICYIDFEEGFEEGFNEALQIENSINDIDLDFTSDEIYEYLSSDYYLDVEF
jgi:hypothetical protein